jgi:PadR family transcriptional regulator PadR
MGSQIRITIQTLQVLQVLLDDPADQHYGLKISERSGLPTGSIYPILARLEAAEWVISNWEDLDESAAGRRRRRYYTLTPDGAQRAEQELMRAAARLSRSQSISPWTGHPQPGGASA